MSRFFMVHCVLIKVWASRCSATFKSCGL